MPIPSSGALSLQTLRTEFIGGTSSIPLGSLYRGGSNIRAKAGNNNAVNLAADVPASGALDVSDFYDQAKGFTFTYSSSGTDQNASAIFGSDYTVDYPKNIVIPAPITLGSANTAEYGLEIDAPASGTITITNNGTIIGAGGGGGQPGSQSCGFSPVCVAVPVGPAGTAGGAAFGTGAAGAVIIRYKFA